MMKNGLRRLGAGIFTGAIALSMMALHATAAHADGLVATVFGGPSGKVYEEFVYGPFAKAKGITIETVPLGPTLGMARMQAEAANPVISVFQFAGSQELVAKKRGLAAKIGDVSDLVSNPAYYDADGEWVAVAASPVGLIYNKDKIEAPTSWNDMLRPEYKGHVAFPTMTNAYGPLTMLMLAIANGGGIDDVDPGFAALKTLVDDGAPILEQLSEVRQLFEQGDMWIIPYDSALAQRLADSGLPVAFSFPEEGVPLQLITHSIAKGTPELELSQQVVRAALEVEAQQEIASRLLWYPANPKAAVPDSMISAEELAGKIALASEADRQTIVDSMADWVDRFKREVLR